ncbi:MAG: hypothetical protein KKI08_02825 [Armatimonadetes bacterium]|nr:hypothetical protein [Armatimonadota bacterium]
MHTRRVRLSGSLVWLLAGAGPALAADKQDPKGAAIALVAVLIVAVLVQFLLAVLLPRFTRRVQRAVGTGFWASAGWGGLVGVLAAVVGMVLAQGGAVGKALAGVVGATVLVAALAGGIGLAKIIGDWTLRRWDAEPVGPLSVLCGATVWAWGVAVPVVGWAAGLLGLFASMGAAVQVLLQGHVFDPPEAHDSPLVAPPEPPTPP